MQDCQVHFTHEWNNRYTQRRTVTARSVRKRNIEDSRLAVLYSNSVPGKVDNVILFPSIPFLSKLTIILNDKFILQHESQFEEMWQCSILEVAGNERKAFCRIHESERSICRSRYPAVSNCLIQRCIFQERLCDAELVWVSCPNFIPCKPWRRWSHSSCAQRTQGCRRHHSGE